MDFLDLLGVFTQTFFIDAILLFSHEALTAQLEEDSFKSCHIDYYLMFVTKIDKYYL
jgi:hypothetical protein